VAIRKIIVICFIISFFIIVSPFTVFNDEVAADPVFKIIYGVVYPNSTTGQRAYDSNASLNGFVYFFIPNRTDEGNGQDPMETLSGIDHYDPEIYLDFGDWQVGDSCVFVVEMRNGSYGTDYAGFIGLTNATLDSNGSQSAPPIELQKMSTPILKENGTNFINITWNQLNDTNNLIDGYMVYRSTTNGTVGGDSDWVLIGGTLNDPVKDLYFNDTSVSQGITYYYSLRLSFQGYEADNPAIKDNEKTTYFGEGSAPLTPLPVPPTVDFIEITDVPNGSPILDSSVFVGFQEWGFSSAYNNTLGYLGVISANWTVEGVDASLLNTTPSTHNGIKIGNMGGSIWFNATINGISDGIIYTVTSPNVDFIQIRNSPNGKGEIIEGKTYSEGDLDTFWAAGYNHTSGYIGDVSALWESNNTHVGSVLSGLRKSTKFTAGVRGGICYVTVSYGSIENSTDDLLVIDVNQPPSALANYYLETGTMKGDLSFLVNITMRVTGTKQNSITMALLEDDNVVKEIVVTREFGSSDIGRISYELNSKRIYEIRLNYQENVEGTNPIMVTFNYLENIYSVPVLFKTQPELNQTAHIYFNDIQKAVGSVFFEGTESFDVEGGSLDFEWDFGDGITGRGVTFLHTYKKNGEYIVSLTVSDSEGVTNETTFTVFIRDMEDFDQAELIVEEPSIRDFLDFGHQYAAVLQCPADLQITAPEGGKIGLESESRINTLEGAFFMMLYSDIEVYFIPQREFYLFDVLGLENGVYNLSAFDINNNVAKKYGINNSSCQSGSLDRIVIYFTDWELTISTDEVLKNYSLNFLYYTESESTDFILSDIKLENKATHTYEIKNWEELGSSEPVTLLIDEDSDGKAEKILGLTTGLTGAEVDDLLLRIPVSEPAFPFALFFIVGFIAAIGVGGLLFEVGKWILLSLIIPLYSKINRDEMLNHPIRHKIHGYIIGNPGAHFGLIKQDLKLGNGQVVYHLKRLLETNLIYSKADGIRKRFYPKDFPQTDTNGYYFTDTEEKILELIEKNKGITQKKIASGCGTSRQVAKYHLSKMEDVGAIKKEIEGRETRYYVTE
jgi:predicted transcriptional regulator/PKD repeat protein